MPVPQNDLDNQAINMLPIAQRLPKWIAMAKALVSQVKRMYRVFTGYMNGESFSAYNPSTAYAAGNCVQYNFKTWESLVDANIGNNPELSPDQWILRNNSFIGATERVKYNGRCINLTYALNRYFGTTFRQPPWPAPYDNGLGGGTFSDIYITNTTILFTTFVSAPLSAGSSAAGVITSSDYASPLPIYGTASTYGFIVHIPIAVYNAQGATNAIRDAVFNRFIGLYAVSGISWTLVTY